MLMGALEPEKDLVPLEVGIPGKVTAPTQELANAICSNARIAVRVRSRIPRQIKSVRRA
ncbi:MAG: hypothetical protein H7340_00370 [Variovorax sp.]|nr:hypothetical protein [Variovorax sp.]